MKSLFVYVFLFLVCLAGPVRADPLLGAWEPPHETPTLPVHFAVLPTGKLLLWSREMPTAEHSHDFAPIEYTQLFDPATGLYAQGPAFPDLFCSGHAFLPNGALLVAGGVGAGAGSFMAYAYKTNTWIQGPAMEGVRYYPTNVPLADGRQLILGGGTGGKVENPLPQIWNPALGWQNLTGAVKVVWQYSWAMQAPTGKVLVFGPKERGAYLDVTGVGAWSDFRGTASHLFRRNGSWAAFGPGQILIAGGGLTPTATAEVINLRYVNPRWRTTRSMSSPRSDLTLVTLPTGQVLATGGNAGVVPAGLYNNPDESTKVLAAEVWTPGAAGDGADGRWTTLARMQTFRGYHSGAVLLPDGRVYVGGGGKKDGFIDHATAELFSPPYLFQGARPVIASAPALVRYGRTFMVQSPEAESITRISLVKLPAMTHSLNMNQGFGFLSFQLVDGQLRVTSPSNPNVFAPGHYMLFLLRDGIPSEAKIIRIL